MISTKNPFPGMNPFMEHNWQPVHTALISFMWEIISRSLPAGLVARPEERLAIDDVGASYRADVSITESWKQGIAPVWQPDQSGGGGVVAAEPELLRLRDDVERWIEIRTPEGRVVTVIEILSPANKHSSHERYKAKQLDYLQSSTSLVEIDLLRAGRRTVPLGYDDLKLWPAPLCYNICCHRAWRFWNCELYRWPLRQRVPAFRIPLRETDKDIVLDLQPLIDRCYEVGRYYMDRIADETDPPFLPEDVPWVEEQLRVAGLRG